MTGSIDHKPVVYSFANCIMSDACEWFLTPIPGWIRSSINLHTEGILRMLNGYRSELDHEQWRRAEDLRDDEEVGPGGLHSIPPLSLENVHGLIWSPFADSVAPVGLGKCIGDRTVYPASTSKVLRSEGRAGLWHPSTLRILWKEFIRLTACVPKRAIVIYPTEHLKSPFMKDRIDRIQCEAHEMFERSGWDSFTTRPVLQVDGGNWAHIDIKERFKLFKRIFDYMMGADP